MLDTRIKKIIIKLKPIWRYDDFSSLTLCCQNWQQKGGKSRLDAKTGSAKLLSNQHNFGIVTKAVI